MYTNFYEIQVHNDDGEVVNVALRLPFGDQIALKNRYKTDTRTVIFEAGNDDEKFVDVLTRSLKWKGNNNTITSGEELIERLIDEGEMGMIARQKLLVKIGHASGIFSDDEMAAVVRRMETVVNTMFNGDGVDDNEGDNEEDYTEKKE